MTTATATQTVPSAKRPNEAAFWNKLAEKYAAQPVDNPEAFDRKIAITKTHIHPGDTVLNVGCGTGSLSLRLASTRAELHGLDISSEMIRIAREKVAAAGADNIRFHVGRFDESFTAFGDGSVDVLMAYSILHLIPEREEALARIYRLLKPGGSFISSTVCLNWFPFAPLLWSMRMIGKAPWVGIVNQAKLIEEFQHQGFVDIEAPDVGAQKQVSFLVAKKPA